MTMLIPLTKGKTALIDEGDYFDVNRFKWHAKLDKSTGRFYAVRSYREGKRVLTQSMHMLLCKGGTQRDHANGNGLDNRRINLRPCSHSQNQANRVINKNNKSGFKGVGFHKASGKWYSSIKKDGVKFHLGLFSSPSAAGEAYRLASVRLFGEFAEVNRREERPQP